jgi:hypothetical protein
MEKSYKQELIDLLIKLMEESREYEYLTYETAKRLANDEIGKINMLCHGIDLGSKEDKCIAD